MITRTLGGDRVGSGKKIKVQLENYGRSNFNLSKRFISSMACGTLVPCYVNVGLNGDTFDIDLNAMVRTIPTIGPLFGSFKLQIDCYTSAMRLYNKKLHNNPIGVGMQMNNIAFQKIKIEHNTKYDYLRDFDNSQINESSVMKYLGLSGIATPAYSQIDRYPTLQVVEREFNALPYLTYLDIFKNYYSNKQEDEFYIIENQSNFFENIGKENLKFWYSESPTSYGWEQQETTTQTIELADTNTRVTITNYETNIVGDEDVNRFYLTNIRNEQEFLNTKVYYTDQEPEDTPYYYKIITIRELIKLYNNILIWTGNNADGQWSYGLSIDRNFTQPLQILWPTQVKSLTNTIKLQNYELHCLDDMRDLILEGKEVMKDIDQATGGLNWLYGNDKVTGDTHNFRITGVQDIDEGQNPFIYDMYGLIVKTYQSDINQNWIKTDIIEGENGIQQITKIDVSDGLIIDNLNLAQKVYNMLNRIAVSGGTYEDWQEAVYGVDVIKKAETPIYYGGASYEIVFEEVISTAATDVHEDLSALGTLGGKGTVINKEGGHIVIHIEEPSIIMCIASITPRINYSQGNKWYLTELKNYGDLHVPELDQIGFQDLIQERLAWFSTEQVMKDNKKELYIKSAGKQPAWLNYMTDIDEVFGDFANSKKAAYMVLNRNYEPQEEDENHQGYDKWGDIQDLTTYIDPQKYNYAFAYQELNAQNFWVQIGFDITARRIMSSKIIPNL